ncbi:MAG: hypothetical protein EOP50_03400 [Sphingobacteriales bacterium]|nr:MAG: hypothetical protein EOP50_03400 [Sphingobacteriales bacterium]
MEKIEKAPKTQVHRLTVAQKPEARNAAAATQPYEQDILDLQEKARRFQRRYPVGGYQGL